MSLHVTIAIVGYRNAVDIARCVAALETSVYEDFEIVICENGGEAAWAALVDRLPAALPAGQPIRIILAPENLGFAGGVNRCLAEAPDAGAWWVLNPDTEPELEALAALVGRLQIGDCEAVGGRLYLPDGRVQANGGRWRPWLARAESMGNGTSVTEAVDAASVERSQNYLLGACMLVGRRFLDVVGPMREDYFLYCEECEWCLRGLAHGMRLGFAPEARVKHHSGTTTGAGEPVDRRPRLPVYLGERNKMLLTRDCFPGRLPAAAVFALALLFIRCARHGAWRHFVYGVQGWQAGLRNERGVPPWAHSQTE